MPKNPRKSNKKLVRNTSDPIFLPKKTPLYYINNSIPLSSIQPQERHSSKAQRRAIIER